MSLSARRARRAWAIASVTAGVLTSGLLAQAAAGQPATGKRDPALPEPGAQCLYVPLHGSFGKEITGPGMRNALRYAKQQKITQVILDFSTGGGVLADGEAVAGQIRELSEGMTIHAVIREAFSAATWPMIECSHIWVAPDARAGAAVAFIEKEDSTGAVEVDRKFNAALAAKLAARAEAKGLPAPLFRAMVDMEAEVWETKDAKGSPKFFDKKPGDNAVEIDSKTSVLALTSQQMIDFGIARPLPTAGTDAKPPASKKIPADLAVFGVLQDGEKGMRDGAAQIQRTNADLERAEKKWKEANQLIADQAKWLVTEVKRAAANDPSTINLYYKQGTRLLTPESQKNWRDQTDQALAIWHGIEKGVSELEATTKGAVTAGRGLTSTFASIGKTRLWEDAAETGPLTPIDPKLNLDTIRKTARDEITRLMKNRDKVYIDQ